jgi:hypothetical protein
MIFDHKPIPSYLQALFRGTYWVRFWSLRLKEDRLVMKIACRSLESTTMEIFASNGWHFTNKIGLW